MIEESRTQYNGAGMPAEKTKKQDKKHLVKQGKGGGAAKLVSSPVAVSAKAQAKAKAVPVKIDVPSNTLYPYQNVEGKMFCYHDTQGRIAVGTPFTARGADGQNVTINDWNKHAKLTVELGS